MIKTIHLTYESYKILNKLLKISYSFVITAMFLRQYKRNKSQTVNLGLKCLEWKIIHYL